MRLLERQLRCEVHHVALGHHDGKVDIEIRSDIREPPCWRMSVTAKSCAAIVCRYGASIRTDRRD